MYHLAVTLSFLLTLSCLSETIGTESFDYSDVPFGGQSGGYGFDFDNTTDDGDPVGHNISRSRWMPRGGTSAILDGQLRTNDSAVLRPYNGPSRGATPLEAASPEERTGVIFEEDFRREHVVYYAVSVTPGASSSSFQISSFDFEDEIIRFGVLPSSPRLAITYDGTTTLSELTPPANTPVTLVAKVDFVNNQLQLWSNPDLTQPEPTPLLTQVYFGDEFSTGLALSSQGLVTWDDLVIATTWEELALPDTDGDGLPNWWEETFNHDPEVSDATRDDDGDGLDASEEFIAGSSPSDADSDRDGLSDQQEQALTGTLAYQPDSDGDGLTDGAEFNTFQSDPLLVDSDGDGFQDREETALRSDPLVSESNPAEWPQLRSAAAAALSNENSVSLLSEDQLLEFIGIPLDAEAELSLSIEFTLQWVNLAPDNGLFGWGGLQLFSPEGNFLTIGNRFGSPHWGYLGSAGEGDFLNENLAPEPLSTDPETLRLLITYRPQGDDVLEIFFREERTQIEGDFSLNSLRAISSFGQTLDLLSLAVIAEQPQANDDEFTIASGQQARILPLANDTGLSAPDSLTLLSNPTRGTVQLNSDGSLVYERDSLSSGDDTFDYQVQRGSSVTSATITARQAITPRFATNYHNLPPEPSGDTFTLVDAFPGLTFDTPHSFAIIEGTDSNKLFVTEADGRVFLIPDVTEPEKILILDITDRVLNDRNERALKGVAPHPDFANNGYLYLTYHHCPAGIDCGEFLGDPGTGNDTVRLSRFTCQTSSPFTADPASELILLEMENEGFIHGIDSCRFANDGYLYVSFGDEGSQDADFGNAQRIDRDFWSSIIRIDVDKGPESVEPNPHPAILLDDGVARYSVPADNPFMGVSSFNNQLVDPVEVRTELYCVGLRNPWQFFPLDRNDDAIIDEVWLGDVGRFDREEVSVLPPGGNGGWGWLEGTIPGPLAGQTINGARQEDADLTAPAWDYPHLDSPFGGNSVTGGVFYQGDNYGALQDRYIFADFVSGNIWSLDNSNTENIQVERIAGESGIVCINTDPATNDLLFLDREDGRIHRLTLGNTSSQIPATLSGTNFFADLATLTPNPGAVPYEINLRFWSDHADKRRWFLLNNPEDQVTFRAEGPWSFPTGMVWAKHFDIELTRGDASTSRRLETRFIVKTEEHVYGLSYRWENISNGLPQNEAFLVPTEGVLEDIPILDNGEALTQSWRFPARSSCLTCHNTNTSGALSFETRQLNREGVFAGIRGNFLDLLDASGFLTDYTPANYPRYVSPDDERYSLTERARSYLAVNCSYCHSDGGSAAGSWDGRPDLTLDQTRLVNGFALNTRLNPQDRLIAPRLPQHSIIYNRATAQNGYTRMPPLATNVIDPEGSALLLAWIGQEVPEQTNYPSWRQAQFGDSTAGETTADPDGDGHNNFYEYLTRTDPHDPNSRWEATLEHTPGEVSLTHQALPDRAITLFSSTDLEEWFPVTDEPLSRNPSTPVTERFPLSAHEFFRFEIEER